MCCCQIDREPLLLDKTDKRQQVLLRLKSKKRIYIRTIKGTIKFQCNTAFDLKTAV